MAIDHEKLLLIHIPRNGSKCIPWGKITNNVAAMTKQPADNYVQETYVDLYGVTKTFNRAVRPDEHSTINAARKFKSIRDGRYDTLLELSENLNLSEYTKITIVRNPFRRTYSLYNHYVVTLCGFRKSEKTFLNFLQNIKLNKPMHPKSRDLAKKTQTSFIVNPSNVIDNSVNIFKNENLDPLKSFLGLDSTHMFSKHNMTCYDPARVAELLTINNATDKQTKQFEDEIKHELYYTLEEMQTAYTQECIDLVLEIFSEDFDNFNYSRNFLDCIP